MAAEKENRLNVKLVENDLAGCYAEVTGEDGDEEVYNIKKSEALIIRMLMALETELDQIREVIKEG